MSEIQIVFFQVASVLNRKVKISFVPLEESLDKYTYTGGDRWEIATTYNGHGVGMGILNIRMSYWRIGSVRAIWNRWKK